VQPRFIVALWGIESNYGKRSGDFPVISALATLAYDGRRSAYFRKELLTAIKIVDQGWIKPEDMLGSWAGAMGQCQFMPSSYVTFAVSYNDDGRRDIWHRQADIFASIANYLARSGWKGDETWGRRVLLPTGFDTNLAGPSNRKPLAEWTVATSSPASATPLCCCRTVQPARRCWPSTISALRSNGTTRAISRRRSVTLPMGSSDDILRLIEGATRREPLDRDKSKTFAGTGSDRASRLLGRMRRLGEGLAVGGDRRARQGAL
jgi:hypothetical protein